MVAPARATYACDLKSGVILKHDELAHSWGIEAVKPRETIGPSINHNSETLISNNNQTIYYNENWDYHSGANGVYEASSKDSPRVL